MLHQIALIVLAVVALISSINAAQTDQPTACVKFGETCNLHLRCCGENLKCEKLIAFGTYKCTEKAKLGDSCRITSQCVDIVHSVCSKNKCECRQNNVKVSDYSCAPILTGYCWSNETCATKNSLCIDNECQCRDGFEAEDNECLPVVIGSECSDDAACASVRFAKCSRRKLCTCSLNTIATNSRLCSVTLGETCNSDRDCGVADSWCDKNKCQCRVQFVAYSNIECRLPYLGMSCKDSEGCRAHIINSICINNVCICGESHTLQDGNTCVAKRIIYCENDEGCVEMNGVCFYDRCRCDVNYVLHESKCLPTKLAGRCKKNSDCAAVNFAECIEGKCACAEGYFVFNATICARALGRSCISDKNCVVRFSGCYDEKCQCNHGYTQNSENQCSAKDLGMTCFDESDCDLINNGHCVESQCSCKDNHIELNSFTCAPLLNAFCDDGIKCASTNSVCVNHKCQCEFTYVPKSNFECVLMFLEPRCRTDKDCSDIRFAKCSDAGKCVCLKNYVQSASRTCLPTLGGHCANVRECVTVNAECSRNRCSCSAGYAQQSDDLCLPVFLGQACDIDEDCNKIINAKCSRKKCQCREGYTKFDRHVCLPLIGTNCVDHKDCAVHNSICVDKTCKCLDTYIPQSQYECVSISIGALCTFDEDCLTTNSRCSRFNFCVCIRNYISMDNATCVRILGAHCSDSENCMTPNSGCIDHKCQCNPNYIQGPYNECSSNLLGSSCQADYDCHYILNAICIDKICVCKPDTFALTPSACAHLLNTTCSSSADCDVEASHCFENKCQCKPDWAALTDMMCVRRSAMYYCDTEIDCGVPWRTRCYQHHCVCNKNHIALNALTCLPVLDGNCWRDDQCMTENSQCIDFQCRCKPGFVSVAINMCVAR